MKTLHFVRHGSVHNPEGIVYGRLPGYYLSQKGCLEAFTAGIVLSDYETQSKTTITAVYHSPLDRAEQTAKVIRGWTQYAEPPRVEVREGLIECGQVFEGQKFPSPEALRNPSNWKYLRSPFRPSWGEPYTEIFERMHSTAQHALADIRDGEAAVLVGHQVPIVIYRRGIEGKPFFHDPAVRQCDPASITTVQYDNLNNPISLSYTNPNSEK